MLLWPWHLTSSCIGVIYWIWPFVLPSIMPITQKIVKILTEHSLCIESTVTLNFDLVTSKCIWVIYWLWPIFKLSTKFIGVIYWPWTIFLLRRMTVSHKLFQILSGQGFSIKCFCDLDIWHIELIMYRGHLLSITNLFTKYHDYHSVHFQDIQRT